MRGVKIHAAPSLLCFVSLVAGACATSPDADGAAPASAQAEPTGADAEGLDWEAFEAWREHFATGAEAWREIPWRASYREGLADAEEAQLPLLLWVMNGHPLGPT